MPWPPKQRVAIFLSVKRKKGEAAARRLMHKHGYGGKTTKKRKKRRHNRHVQSVGARARERKGGK